MEWIKFSKGQANRVNGWITYYYCRTDWQTVWTDLVKKLINCLQNYGSEWNWWCLSVILVEVIMKILLIEREDSILISVLSLGDMTAFSLGHSWWILLFSKCQFERTGIGDVNLLFQSLLDSNIFGLFVKRFFYSRDRERKAYFDRSLSYRWATWQLFSLVHSWK